MSYDDVFKFAGCSFSDVYIIPQFSSVSSRKNVDTSTNLGNLRLDVPVISANMDTVTDSSMAIAMFKGGGIGALHRFLPIEDAVSEYKLVRDAGCEAITSVGVKSEDMERVRSLYSAGSRYILIDIAHGHSELMKIQIERIKGEFSDVFLIAGNVATVDGVRDLSVWGADAIKVGVGPGAVCLTKNVTGVTVPQFGAIEACSKWTSKPIIADGGLKEYGDIAKALGIGASMVMCGSLLAGAREAPGERIEMPDGKREKVYRGMASREAMLTIRNANDLPTPEGKSELILLRDESAVDILKNIKGALSSAFSYSNAHNLKEFTSRCTFGIRK